MRAWTGVIRSTPVPRTAGLKRAAVPRPQLCRVRRHPLGWHRHGDQALAVCASAAADSNPGSNHSKTTEAGSGNTTGSSIKSSIAAFNQLESLISKSFGSDGPGGDWKQVDECWVLYPPQDALPKVLVHFLGGAFVGAAPQLAYRPLLEALAARGALVVTTPYATSFDHIREADAVYFRFQRCLKALGPTAIALQQFGVGHSFGSLLHLLINARYVAACNGNIFMSFNNRPATDSIPLLSPLIAPSIRVLGPILSRLAASPLQPNIERVIDALKGVSPPLVKQIVPLLEQLVPIYLDIANGAQEFTPSPEGTRAIICEGYTVPRNLLLRFSSDSIDQTSELASTLESSTIATVLELTVKTLPGDHVRPLQQDLSRISPDLVRVANQAVEQSNNLLGRLSVFAARSGLPEQAEQQLTGFANAAMGMATMVGEAVLNARASESIESLADELAGWMGLPAMPSNQKLLVLPSPPSPSSEPRSPCGGSSSVP